MIYCTNVLREYSVNIISSFKHLKNEMYCVHVDKRNAHTHTRHIIFHNTQHTQHSNSKTTVQAIAI